MSDEERNTLEESSFEVEELDDSQLANIAGGLEADPENGSMCSCVNKSQCICPS